MQLSTFKHAPSGLLHQHIGRYVPHPVALAHACELTCQYPCPGSSTSFEMCDEHMLAEGIGKGLVRMSNGFTGTIAQRWQQLSSALKEFL